MDQPRQEESGWTDGSRRQQTDPKIRPSSDHLATPRVGGIRSNAQSASRSEMRDATPSLQRNNASSHTAGLTMGPDQSPTLPNDLSSRFRPPNTDETPFQSGLPAGRLLDPSRQSHVPHPSHGHFPSGNEATASFAVQGIELESPRPAEGGSIARARRDTSITLSFDMQVISRGIATYDGLKIPSTPSVKQTGSETGKNLLYLQIRVLGATTKAPYDDLCHECKNRAGNGTAFPDFRAKSNILVPGKNAKSNKVIVAFTLACCSKHRKPNDSEYRLDVILYGSAEYSNPLIQYELPYSFDIVSKLPPRTRNQADDADAVDDVVLPPQKVLRTVPGHSSPARNRASQSGPSRRAGRSSRGPRGLINNMSPPTSEVSTPPADNHDPETVLDALGRAPSHLTPEGFNSLSDHDTDMASGDIPDLERQLDALDPFQCTGSGHGASDSDENDSDRVYQAQSDPMDVCHPIASTSKAAFGGPKGRAQYSRAQRSQKNRRIPDVPYDPDINTFLPKLRERFAHTEAIEYLCKEVFPTGQISLAPLRALMDPADGAQSAHMNEKYHGLLLKSDDSSCMCRLCPRDNELHFSDDEEALHHITVTHLDMGYGCKCGCGRTYWNTRDLTRHLTRVARSG